MTTKTKSAKDILSEINDTLPACFADVDPGVDTLPSDDLIGGGGPARLKLVQPMTRGLEDVPRGTLFSTHHNAVLAAKGEDLVISILAMKLTWREFESSGERKLLWQTEDPDDPRIAAWLDKDGEATGNYKLRYLDALVVAPIGGEDPVPMLVTFGGLSYNAGREVCNQLKGMKGPNFAKLWAIRSAKKNANDENYILSVKFKGFVGEGLGKLLQETANSDAMKMLEPPQEHDDMEFPPKD